MLHYGTCMEASLKYPTCTVYPKKYAHGFVVLCFVVVMQSFIMNSHEVFIHIHQGCFAGTGAIVRLPQCQWSKPDGYGKISQCITTTKHSKAKTVCIFLGIYCMINCTTEHSIDSLNLKNPHHLSIYIGDLRWPLASLKCKDCHHAWYQAVRSSYSAWKSWPPAHQLDFEREEIATSDSNRTTLWVRHVHSGGAPPPFLCDPRSGRPALGKIIMFIVKLWLPIMCK